MDLDKKTEQPQEDSAITKQPDTNNDSKTIDLGDGQEVTLEELKKGYLRQSDYTKKTQELASKKTELSEEDEKALKVIKDAGFATVEDIANFKKEQEQNADLKNLITNVDLSETQLKMVQDLKKVNPDKSYADIANEYWVIDEAKLNKVKGWFGVKGNSFALPKKEEPYKVDVTKAGYNPEQAAEVAKMKF